jgi:predicted AAA+ superfamily ATPase
MDAKQHFPYQRPLVAELERDLARAPDLLLVVTGPRQVGKTTAARAVLERWEGPRCYAAADRLLTPAPEWLVQQWEAARREARCGPALLVLDEVQHIPRWSEVVKAEWDADRLSGVDLRVIVLGSSALGLARGASESLAGRFLLHRAPHWSFAECRAAFGWSLDQWLCYGGYPRVAGLLEDEDLWRGYVLDSLVEATLGRDVLALQAVAKPALLRQVFAFACAFPAQVVSYNKILGQLQDAGNTTTVAQYLQLLGTAFLVARLERFSAGRAHARASSPKLVPLANSLVTAMDGRSQGEARVDGAWWGRLVENAVGAHLVAGLAGPRWEVTYWRDGADEVDYVVKAGQKLWAIEVKSGRPRPSSGLAAFLRLHPQARPVLVGRGGLELEDFFRRPAAEVLGA